MSSSCLLSVRFYPLSSTHRLTLNDAVVLAYDYLLTLPAEVHFIWERPKRGSSYWFFLNRYLALSTTLIMAVFTFANLPPEVRREPSFIRVC